MHHYTFNILNDMCSYIIESLVIILFSYILFIILSIIFPYAIPIILLGIYFISPILSLRIAIVGFIALTINQYTLLGIANELGMYNLQLPFINGFLFYFILFIIFSKIIKPVFKIDIVILTLLFFLSILKSYPYIIKASIIYFNVIGGFLALTIILSSSRLRKKGEYYLSLLFTDIINIIILISILSILIVVIDLPFNLWLLKFQSEYLAIFRGDSNISSNEIGNAYLTSLGPIDLWIRYTPLINDPIRAAYWYFYILIFAYLYFKGSLKNLILKVSIISISLLFLILCLSKGALLLILYLAIFSFLFKKRKYTIAIFIFILIVIVSIILSLKIKSSAAIHVLGLLFPFQQKISLEFFIGNKLALAGNMGRIPGESWLDSVSRGAESLVGTYMYAVGLLGVILFIKIHWRIITTKINEGKYILAALITSILINSFLQENIYNIMQVFPLLFLALFLNFFIYPRRKK